MSIEKFMAELQQRLQPIAYETVDTRAGSRVTAGYWQSGRYAMDYSEGRRREGWESYDTFADADYFGLWFNRRKCQVLLYQEGTWTLIECTSEAEFCASVSRVKELYAEESDYAIVA